VSFSMRTFRTLIILVAVLLLVAAICEIIASVALTLPASSLATSPALALLGMVAIISTPKPKAVAIQSLQCEITKMLVLVLPQIILHK
jgi:HAMP domain-containing protein